MTVTEILTVWTGACMLILIWQYLIILMSILLSNTFVIILATQRWRMFYKLSKLEFVINIFHNFLISFLTVSYFYFSHLFLKFIGAPIWISYREVSWPLSRLIGHLFYLKESCTKWQLWAFLSQKLLLESIPLHSRGRLQGPLSSYVFLHESKCGNHKILMVKFCSDWWVMSVNWTVNENPLNKHSALCLDVKFKL